METLNAKISSLSPPQDENRCKKTVSSGTLGIIKNQCKRKATKDGYCWQHHPAAVKKREQHAEKKLAATPFYMLH